MDDIVNGLEATSSASHILDGVLETAWESIRLESTWRMLQEDRAMQDIILARIKDMEEAKARDELIKLEVVDMVNIEKDNPVIMSGKDMNISEMSTNNTKDMILLTMSTEDMLRSKKDMSVSTVSTNSNNEDILLEQTGDI